MDSQIVYFPSEINCYQLHLENVYIHITQPRPATVLLKPTGQISGERSVAVYLKTSNVMLIIFDIRKQTDKNLRDILPRHQVQGQPGAGMKSQTCIEQDKKSQKSGSSPLHRSEIPCVSLGNQFCEKAMPCDANRQSMIISTMGSDSQ